VSCKKALQERRTKGAKKCSAKGEGREEKKRIQNMTHSREQAGEWDSAKEMEHKCAAGWEATAKRRSGGFCVERDPERGNAGKEKVRARVRLLEASALAVFWFALLGQRIRESHNFERSFQ